MNSIEGTRTHPQAVAALACLLTLGLGACDQGTSTGSADTDVERVIGQDARAREQLADIADQEAKRDAGEPTPAAARTPDDIALSAKVRSALTAESDFTALEVDADDGAVTLFGTAKSRERRDKATQVALNVDGVKSVRNHLIILKGS